MGVGDKGRKEANKRKVKGRNMKMDLGVGEASKISAIKC